MVFAAVVFAMVQLGSNSDGSEATPTATPRAAAPAATATPSVLASSRAATPTAAATLPATATLTVAATPSATPATPKDPDSCDFRDEFERVRGAIVRIRAPESPYSGSQGTGFHIGGGEYVTAAHVVQDERGRAHDEIYVESYVESYVASAVTGRSERAEVVSAGSFSTSGDRQHRDIAILRSELVVEHSIRYRTPGDGDIGRDVRALGYPWSQVGDDSAAVQRPVVVRGVLSNAAVRDNIAVVQADVQAQSGMSGGPLVDECGFVLAVASAVPRALRGEAGDGLTVFISMAELEKLR